MVSLFFWLAGNAKGAKSLSLRAGAAAAIFHAFRVLIYVLGRTEPLMNFDLKPQFHSSHHVDIFWVYFAAVLSVLGVLGVIIIRVIIKRNRRRER